MDELLEKIKALSQTELDEVMHGIEKWYEEAYPDWDVVYIAMPKDPVQRKQRFMGVLRLIAKDLEWYEQKYSKGTQD